MTKKTTRNSTGIGFRIRVLDLLRISPVVFRMAAIFLPAVLVIGGVVLALYYLDRDKEEMLSRQTGTHLVDLHCEIINRESKTVQSDLLFLANQAILRDYFAGRAARKELQEEYALFCRQRGVYDQIRYLDTTGQERIRVNYQNGLVRIVPENELQFKGNRYYFVQTMHLDCNQVFVSPLDLNVEHGRIERPLKPVIRFATPVYGVEEKKKGILVLNYLGAKLIDNLSKVSQNFEGKSLLLNPQGHFLRGQSPEDEWGFLFGHSRTFAAFYPNEWRRLKGEEYGQFMSENGLFTFRTVMQRTKAPVRRSLSETNAAERSGDRNAVDATLKVVSHIPSDLLHGQSTLLLRRLLIFSGIVLILWFCAAMYLAYGWALRRRQEQQIADSEARLRVLSTRLITAQEDERRRFSRDLHDELGQLATVISLDLQRCAQADDPAKKDNLVGRAVTETECLLNRIHEISAGIRPMILDDLGLKDAVQNLLSDFERRTGMVAIADLQFDHDNLPETVAENTYRILQEALTNAAKHADVENISVELHVAAEKVSLIIQDRGKGFVPRALGEKALGVLGMRERAELLDGKFVIKAAPGKGTEITVSIPL